MFLIYLQHARIFSNDEKLVIETNIVLLQLQVRLAYQHALDSTHHGRPSVVRFAETGRPGRPRMILDETFLRFAYQHQCATGIARTIGCLVSTVRQALLDYGISEPGDDPFPLPPGPSDPLYGTNVPAVDDPPHHLQNNRVSTWTDAELDTAIYDYRTQFPQAGIAMLIGYLKTKHQVVPRERVRASLARINPVQRVFGRIKIVRCQYSVPGPNALWHHDGQHGMWISTRIFSISLTTR